MSSLSFVSGDLGSSYGKSAASEQVLELPPLDVSEALQELLLGQQRLEYAVQSLLQRAARAEEPAAAGEALSEVPSPTTPPPSAMSSPCRSNREHVTFGAEDTMHDESTLTGIDVKKLKSIVDLGSNWPACIKRRAINGERVSVQLGSSGAISLGRLKDRPMPAYVSMGETERPVRLMRVLHPCGPLRVAFDCLTAVALLIDLIFLPVFVAWELPLRGGWLGLTWYTALHWTFEFILNFRTGFYENGELILAADRVAKHYLRTWCLLDAVLLLVTYVSMVVDDSVGSFRVLRIAKILRILRLAGLLRVFRVDSMLRQYAGNFDHAALALADVPKLITTLLFINHLSACCWFAISSMAGGADTHYRWLDQQASPEGVTYSSSTMMFQYLTSFHWSLCQMTPGSLTVDARNSPERIFNIAWLLLGMVFFSSVISTISNKVSEYSAAKRAANEAMSNLNQWLREGKIKTSMAVAARMHARSRLAERSKAAPPTRVVFEVLPSAFQCKLYYERVRAHLTHPIFRWWEAAESTILEKACFECVEFRTLGPSEVLFNAGTAAPGMVTLVSGALEYRTAGLEHEDAGISVPRGSNLAEAGLWTHWSYVGAAIAVERCEVLMVNAATVCGEHSVFSSEVFAAYGRVFWSRLIASSCPTDLEVPFTQFAQVLCCLGAEVRASMSGACLAARARHLPVHRDLEDCLTEVEDGQSSFCLDPRGTLQRVVTFAYVRLLRDDGSLLVKLASLPDPEGGAQALHVKVQLPGARANCRPLRAAKTLLRRQLSCLGRCVELSEDVKDIEESSVAETSTFYTTELKFIFDATVSEDEEVSERSAGAQAVPLPQLEYGGSHFAFLDPFLTSLAGYRELYAWVQPRDFGPLAQEDAQEVLRRHLAEALQLEAAAFEAVGRDPGVLKSCSV